MLRRFAAPARSAAVRAFAGVPRGLTPLGDRVLIQRLEAKATTTGGVILPDAGMPKVNEGTVLAVGPGGRTQDGTIVPMDVEVGDRVLLPEFGGALVKLGDDEYFLFRNSDFLGKFE